MLAFIVRALGRTCRACADARAWILLLDAVRIHFHDRVLAAMIRNGFSAIYVPAGMTWLLQPLDTHCFSLFKRGLRKAYVDVLIQRMHPVLAVADWLNCLVRAIVTVIVETDWAHAFSRDGYALGQNFVAVRVLANLGLDEAPFLEPRALTVEEYALLLPRRTLLQDRMLHASAPRNARDIPLEPPPLPPPLEPPPVWFGRTRSSSHLALPPPTAEAGPPAVAETPAFSALDEAAAEAGVGVAPAHAGPIARRTRSRLHL